MNAAYPIPDMPADEPPPSAPEPIGVSAALPAALPPDLEGESEQNAQRGTRVSRVLEEIPYYPRGAAHWGINE